MKQAASVGRFFVGWPVVVCPLSVVSSQLLLGL
jgi:hypothetical protein